MDAALKIAIETYAALAQMSELDVAAEIESGNEIARQSVIMLLFSVA